MRRDFFLDNDSGGLSVLSGASIQEMIEDARSNDSAFVADHRALLLMMYGDDSMAIRAVVDEPLTAEEESQWLARIAWKIRAPDGRVVVSGGYDPDVLAGWLEETGGERDAWGTKVIELPKGTWRVDLYTHVGSMSGRHLLEESGEKPAAWFRRAHPGAAFPLWLAQRLEFSGADDPGHEKLWSKPAVHFKSGELPIDVEHRSFVGYLLHFTRDDGGELSPSPVGTNVDGWFDLETGARTPAKFPLGLPSTAEDPNLASFADGLTEN